MSLLIVVNNPRDWPLAVPGVTVVPARAYLTDPAYGSDRFTQVFNLCKTYRYQSLGYYVSLLAEARGHKPLPRSNTIEDLKSQNLVRLLTEGLDELIQKSLASIKSDAFELSIYFGRNVASRHGPLSWQLFNLLQAPLLRANFERLGHHWRIRSVRPIAASDIPTQHQEFAIQATRNTSWAAGGGRASVSRRVTTSPSCTIQTIPSQHPIPRRCKSSRKRRRPWKCTWSSSPGQTSAG